MQEHIKEMAALQRSLLLQQHKAHLAQLERQKDAVRDEIEQVAQMLISSRKNVRTTDQMTSSSSQPSSSRGVDKLKEMFIRQGQPRMAQLVNSKFQSLPTHQAMAWHQRFSDNFRLRKLQHQALRLRGPVLLKPDANSES